jgi:hypothetical protein
MRRIWIVDAYPKAISILDDYHVAEHLYRFAEKQFPNQKKRMHGQTGKKN